MKEFIAILTKGEEREALPFKADGINHAALIMAGILKQREHKKFTEVTISMISESISLDLENNKT